MSTLEYSRWDIHPTTSLLDLEGCYEDMLSASDLFERFCAEFSSRDFVLLDALATAAVIRYGRSFGSGVRPRLDIANLPEVSKEDMSLHRDILAIRNKHSAHPVNLQETHAVMVGHRAIAQGREVTVVSSSTLVATAVSVDLADQANRLCLRWADWLDAERKTESDRLLVHAQSLSDSELVALPKGPIDINLDPHQHRRQRR
jgi:hypothetical protein